MPSTISSPQDYIQALSDDRKRIMIALRNAILENLPQGFTETLTYGMIGYVVPHTLYPPGYHADPKLPLPFICIASQKAHIALYHMGMYGDAELIDWFKNAYSKQSAAKLDMGKSCIRFKNPDAVPIALIGELAAKRTPQQWIALYETTLKNKT